MPEHDGKYVKNASPDDQQGDISKAPDLSGSLSLSLVTSRSVKPTVSDAPPPEGDMSAVEARFLARGMTEPGGKLPLFDDEGQRVRKSVVQSCIDQGWAEPWYRNPIKPDWLVCKLTKLGRRAVSQALLPGKRVPNNADQAPSVYGTQPTDLSR